MAADLVIRGGTVVDGTGAPGVRADVAIRDGRISEIGTGLAAGDTIDVTLAVDATPRTVDVPADLAAALEAGGVRPFFDGLSNSLQRYHVDNVNGAKTDDTRRRRVEKSVELFQAGKQR